MTWIAALPKRLQAQHTCNACRRFVEKYGGLVTIDALGDLVPAMFDRGPGVYAAAFDAVSFAVQSAKVTGVFVSSEKVWGLPENRDRVRGTRWSHMAVVPPPEYVYKSVTKKAHEVAAEKSEEFGMLCRGLADFDAGVISRALAMVKPEALFRGEKVEDRLSWLLGLAQARMTSSLASNLIWRAVATAPAGWCHVRSGMVGTLLEDVAAGLDFATIKRKFDEKMNPFRYQRPQAPPKAGNIVWAEKIVAALESAGAFARRYARIEELDALWKPLAPRVDPTKGLFDHLKNSTRVITREPISAPAMTWEKFKRIHLDANPRSIECLVPSSGDFYAMVTAENPDAPPILQWDTEERRNPVSWYTRPGTGHARSWNLTANRFVKVTAISFLPFMWGERRGADHGEGVMFVLDGCRDTGHGAGLAIFPEILKSEYHGVRSTIEAYSRSRELGGREEASACGLVVRKGHTTAVRLRVTAQDGTITDVTVDRWD